MKPAIFLSTVIQPVLRALAQYDSRMNTPAAEVILLGTCAQESDFCAYGSQTGGGPALGVHQVERATHTDLWVNFILPRPNLARIIDECVAVTQVLPMLKRDPGYLDSEEFHAQLEYNWAYCTAMARVKYWRSREAMPAADDLPGLGRYYERVYNAGGKGTAQEWVESYKYFVLGERA